MSDKVPIRRLPTGVPGLDAVLGGGVPEFSFNVIAGTPGAGKTTLAQQISQQTLADMVGTTRSRVNFFMNKFKRLGYIECSGGLTVNDSLATIVV
jgi:KaiC/GvpD/RAD55 family RecA-like ATPase